MLGLKYLKTDIKVVEKCCFPLPQRARYIAVDLNCSKADFFDQVSGKSLYLSEESDNGTSFPGKSGSFQGDTG